MKAIVLLVLVFQDFGLARPGFGPGDQDWGYVTVREQAHMFWWLYFTTANVDNYTDRPLVVWLQGGPGGSSAGHGNFLELGPLDVDLNERNYTWVKDVNVLFVDNPVGTGFSYVENNNALTTTNRQIATDFLELMKGFYGQHPEFIPVPFYIVSQSYGGKMTIEIALVLDQAIVDGSIKSNFMGVGLGNSWVDPVTIVLEWAPYLFSVGAVDEMGHNAVAEAAELTKKLFDEGQYLNSTYQWAITEWVIAHNAANIDFYNILTPIEANWKYKLQLEGDKGIYDPMAKPQTRNKDRYKLFILMPKVKEALGLNVTWGSEGVFSTLSEDFMKPVTNIVEEVLNTTDIKVAVYNGQLDLIVCTPGVVKWVDSLQWSGSKQWATAQRPPIAVNGIYEGFEKVVGNLAFYWVNRAGHAVPAENPAAMDYILRQLTQDYDGTAQRK